MRCSLLVSSAPVQTGEELDCADFPCYTSGCLLLPKVSVRMMGGRGQNCGPGGKQGN
jgi:hypothetical protein